MRAARKKRLYLVLLTLIGVSIAVALALNAFNQNLMYFYSPTEVMAGEAPHNINDHASTTGEGMITTISRIAGTRAGGGSCRSPSGRTGSRQSDIHSHC